MSDNTGAIMNKEYKLKTLVVILSAAAFIAATSCGSTPKPEPKPEPPKKEEPKPEPPKKEEPVVKKRDMGAVETALVDRLNSQLSNEVPPILFEAYKSEVTAVVFKEKIEKYFPIIKEIVNQVPGSYVVQVTGYANPPKDASTDAAKKLALTLSKERARNVMNKLIQKGISGAKLTAKGEADAERVTQTFNKDDMDSWAKNRRVILKIIKK